MRLLFIICILLISACANTPNNDYTLKTGLKQLELGILFVDEDDNPLFSENLPKSAYITFPIIPGGIAGTVLTDSVFTTEVMTNSQFTLDLAALSKDILPFALPMLSNRYNDNLTIVPSDAKLLRMGTFSYSKQSNDFIVSTGIGLLNEESFQPIVLVYFDRPARVSGIQNKEGETFEYNIAITEPGFALLEFIEIDTNHFKVVTSQSTKPKAIIIEYNDNTESSI